MSCFLYPNTYEGYIVPVNHSEKFGTIEKFDVDDSKVCVGDMKSFLHNSMIECDRNIWINRFKLVSLYENK